LVSDQARTQTLHAARAGEELLEMAGGGADHLLRLRELQNALIQEGQAIVNLSMVNPDLAPPRPVLDRLLESATKITTHRYSVSRGVRRLRDAFAQKYQRSFGVTLDPESEVCVCLGSKDATFHALRAVVRTGEAVVVAAPSYPAHLAAVGLAGARRIEWRIVEDSQAAAASLDVVLAASGAKTLLLTLPSNPAGMTVTEEWWDAIGQVCVRHGVTVVNDFVYGEMCFSQRSAVSALLLRKLGVSCVEVYSLSKSYNVPGWRVGALVGNAAIVKVVSRLKAQADYGLFLPLQHAAAFALTTPDDLVRPTVLTYERRIKVLAAGLNRLGWEVSEPGAGASVWAKYPEALGQIATPGISSKSVGLTHALLKKHGVLLTPGIVFGQGFDDYIRFAAVVSEERIRDVLSALGSLNA
jgi:alanine-synthesizing transaminase